MSADHNVPETDDLSIRCDEAGLPYAPGFDDHYFSRIDGRAETAHVFLNGNGLPDRWLDGADFTIGELGFGTGLNFVETWRQWLTVRQPGQRLRFVSVEAHPPNMSIVETALAPWPQLAELTKCVLHRWQDIIAPSKAWIVMDDQTELLVLRGDVAERLPDFPLVDAWYLDGFAPAKNPAMWSAEVMGTMASRSRDGTSFASYTAAGWVRRNLQAAGFSVVKMPGFGSKREMIAGRFMPHVSGRETETGHE